MALKKSDLYSSLWASCDELRGGMDASQYKDYVLFMLFIKYISDKYGDSDDFAPPVNIPQGASFSDMITLKGKSDIGDKINTQVIQPLIDANARLARSDFPDFNDPNKLGEGQAMVDFQHDMVVEHATGQVNCRNKHHLCARLTRTPHHMPIHPRPRAFVSTSNTNRRHEGVGMHVGMPDAAHGPRHHGPKRAGAAAGVGTGIRAR